jgi:hypothetical protein
LKARGFRYFPTHTLVPIIFPHFHQAHNLSDFALINHEKLEIENS